MKMTKLFLPAALLLTANAVNANENTGFGIQASLGLGGDTIITGDAGTTTLTAGDNIRFGGYVQQSNLVLDLSGKLALNYINGSKSYSNAEEDLTTFSVDLLLMKEVGNGFSFGGGLTYHLSPSYELVYNDGDFSKVDYDNALGFVLEAKKTLTFGLELSLIYTNIEYTGTANPSNSGLAVSEDINASNISFAVGYTF
jgi:hypothetical protein